MMQTYLCEFQKEAVERGEINHGVDVYYLASVPRI